MMYVMFKNNELKRQSKCAKTIIKKGRYKTKISKSHLTSRGGVQSDVEVELEQNMNVA